MESMRQENATLKQVVEQERAGHQEAMTALEGKCETLTAQLSGRLTEKEDAVGLEREVYELQQRVEEMQQRIDYQVQQIYYKQIAIDTLGRMKEDLEGGNSNLEKQVFDLETKASGPLGDRSDGDCRNYELQQMCSVERKRRMSLQNAKQAADRELMKYHDALRIPVEDVEVTDLKLGHGSFGGK